MLEVLQWARLSTQEKKAALTRPFLKEEKNTIEETKKIITAVKERGDCALRDFGQAYDNVTLAQFLVSPAEIEAAFQQIDSLYLEAIQFAKFRIEANLQQSFPSVQKIQESDGIFCERQPRPIQRVGLYVPGGSAPLVSSVLMLAIPAAVAGCPLRILCTPPDRDGRIAPSILVAASLSGIKKIYKIGGAQAIAAMAYGTETVPKVDKIFGPGNAWVTAAKRLVSQDPLGAAIDMPAGPSELMVIVDEEANPDYAAADLLSQAEHGADSQVILISASEKKMVDVQLSIAKQISSLSRKAIVAQSLAHSRAIFVTDLETAFDICNEYAPEHLILQIKQAEQSIENIKNAGAVFLGPWTAEALGDYVTGSNHVLPTYGYAKNYSGLSTMDFMKWISFQSVSIEGLKKIGPAAESLADIEGLDAHKKAVTCRLNDVINFLE